VGDACGRVHAHGVDQRVCGGGRREGGADEAHGGVAVNFLRLALVRAFQRLPSDFAADAPIGAIFTASFAAIVWQLILEEKQKGRIKGMFGAYVSPQLVERMVESGENPQLGGHDDEITAYFSDIQSFSSFSEKLGSGPLVELMNEYLTACTDIVQGQGGTLDKYIGDAVVAMFGAPLPLKDHAYRACVATQMVHRKLAELRGKWKSGGREVAGDRVEHADPHRPQHRHVHDRQHGQPHPFQLHDDGRQCEPGRPHGERVRRAGAPTPCAPRRRSSPANNWGAIHVVFRPLGRIVVKGRTTAVPIHEIVGLKEHVTSDARECIGLFERGLASYYAREWEAALALFAKSRDLEPNVPGKTPGVVSNPSLVYLGRVVPEAMEDPPAADWDGRYVMKEK
jgi:adenylate cyclase